MNSLAHYYMYAMEGHSGELRWHRSPADFRLKAAYSMVTITSTGSLHTHNCSLEGAKKLKLASSCSSLHALSDDMLFC